MLKLKLQYFGHLMRRVDSLEKTLMLGGIGGRRRRGRQRMRWLDGIMDSVAWVWVNSWCWWWTGRPGVLRFMGSQRVGHDWATELNWGFKMSRCMRGWIFSWPENCIVRTQEEVETVVNTIEGNVALCGTGVLVLPTVSFEVHLLLITYLWMWLIFEVHLLLLIMHLWM